MLLMTVLFLFTIIFQSSIIAFIWKRSIGECFAVALSVDILLLYFSGLIANFTFGIIGIIAVTVAGSIYVIYRLKKDVTIQLYLGVYQDYTILVLFAFSGVFLFFNYGRYFSFFDEFSHWGLAIKNLYTANDFVIGQASNDGFHGYPPAASLVGYFIQLFGTEFNEGAAVFAQATYTILFWFPVLSILSKKNLVKSILISGIIFLFPIHFFHIGYYTLYVDMMLGVIFASVLLNYFLKDNLQQFDYIQICLGLSILTLTKASGLGLSAMAIVFILLDFYNQRKVKRYKLSFIACKGLFMFLSVLASNYSWKLFLWLGSGNKAWNMSNITIHNLLETCKEIMGLQQRSYRCTVIKKFILATLQDDIVILPFIGWFALFCVLAIIAHCVTSDIRLRNFIIFGTVGNLLYAASLLILYLYSYSESEALELASYNRYMSTYVLGFSFTILILFLKSAKGTVAWICCLVFLCLSPAGLLETRDIILMRSNIAAVRHERQELSEIINHLKPFFEQKDAKMFGIFQNDSRINRLIFNYMGFPFDEGACFIDEGAPEIYSGNYMSSLEWEKFLLDNDFTYVYIYQSNEYFVNTFSTLFENRNEIADNTLFQIEKQNGVILKKVDME